MEITTIALKDIKPHPKNPNTHPESQLIELQDSLNQFDQVKNIVTWKGFIIAGHGLVEAAKMKGLTTIKAVDVSSWHEEKALSFMIADNRLPELGIMNNDQLADLLKGIENPLDVPGIDDLFLEELGLDDGREEEEFPEDIIDPGSNAIAKKGELWLLDGHRLLCGDCTIGKTVDRLMAGGKADLVFTDPPYGINIVSKKGKVGGRNLCKTGVYAPIANDNTTKAAKKMYEMLKNDIVDKFIIFGGNYFTDFLPPSSCWLIWDKKGDMNSNNFADCEMAWTNFDKPARIVTHLWRGMIKQGEHGKRLHPTQKPVDLLANIIEEYTNKEDIILDTFLGSGSTLIACEKTKRKCYGTEIDEKYCTVILQRWAEYTGKDPVREDGVSFSELKKVNANI